MTAPKELDSIWFIYGKFIYAIDIFRSIEIRYLRHMSTNLYFFDIVEKGLTKTVELFIVGRWGINDMIERRVVTFRIYLKLLIVYVPDIIVLLNKKVRPKHLGMF